MSLEPEPHKLVLRKIPNSTIAIAPLGIDTAIRKLKQVKAKAEAAGYTKIRTRINNYSWSYNNEVEIYGYRLETDQEYKYRIDSQAKFEAKKERARLKKEKQQLAAKKRRRQQYLKLQKEFGHQPLLPD